MKKPIIAAGVVLFLLAIILIQFASEPLVAQDFPTPTLPVPYATLPPDPILSTLATEYPRVDSSISALPLQRLVACKIMGVPCVWIEHWGGEGSIWPFDSDMSPGGEGDRIAQIQANGTHKAYMNLDRGGHGFDPGGARTRSGRTRRRPRCRDEAGRAARRP